MEHKNEFEIVNNQPRMILVTNEILLPCTASVPEDFKKMLVLRDTLDEEYRNNNHLGLELSNATFSTIENYMFVDMAIGYIAKDLDIVQLCTLINHMSHVISVSKDTVTKILKKHIENVGTDTYVWNQLSNKTEYSYYQFQKRNWPVKKENNIDWQTIAKKIGLVEKIYPGEAAKAAERKDVNENKKNKENKQKQPASPKNLKKELNRLNEQEEEFDAGSDLEDDDDVDLLALLNDKAKHVRRDEKLRKLRAESNYATYGIPDVKEINSMIGFTKDDVLSIYDACVDIGHSELAVLYACRLFVSRKYFHLALKNPPFMNRINDMMKDNRRVYTLVKYVMSYSFYMLHKEERLLGRKITKNNRSIMDEDEFRALPIFDGELEESPYCTEIYHNNKQKNLREQLMMYLGGERKFTDKKEFRRRLSILSGNMLDDIDLSEHEAFLTGSSLVPCIVTNPLEENFSDHDNPFATFLENYYPSYDSLKSYREKVETSFNKLIDLFNTMSEKIPYLIPDEYNKIKDCQRLLEYIDTLNQQWKFPQEIQTAVDVVSNTYTELLYMEKKLADLDIAIVATSREDYDKKVFAIFEKIKANLVGKENNHVYLYKQPLKYGFKWVLKGPGAQRPIDFFKIFVPVHVLLFRFHLNIVRFWWDGKKIRGLSSAVAAALSGVNQWYRWFSNNKDPMDIALKNMERGYTLLLNVRECAVLKVYVAEVDKYKHLINVITVGKIHRHNTLFGHEGGIRYQLPDMIFVCDKYNDVVQHWENPSYTLKRVGCSLETNSYGKIISPKIYAFEAIIRDLMDS